jgi:probable HAF family extracellular repeat protein
MREGSTVPNVRGRLAVRVWLTALVAGAVVSGAMPAILLSAPRPEFTITSVSVIDLGSLGGAYSTAYDINDHGEAVGWSRTLADVPHATLYRAGGGVTDLGSWRSLAISAAHGINNDGEIAGGYVGAGSRWRAVGWVAGWMVELDDTIVAGDTECGRSTLAFDVNGAGTLVGLLADGAHPPGAPCVTGSQAARWTGLTGAASVVPSATRETIPYAIASDGGITGQRGGSPMSAARWRAGAWATVPMPATPAGTVRGHSRGNGINARGAVVGSVDFLTATGTLVTQRAFSWDGVSATSIDLGLLPRGTRMDALDVNEAGFVAGFGNTTVTDATGTRTVPVAWMFHPSLGLRTLPAFPGTEGCNAYGINQRHKTTGLVQIVGRCGTRAVRWDVVAVRTPEEVTP